MSVTTTKRGNERKSAGERRAKRNNDTTKLPAKRNRVVRDFLYFVGELSRRQADDATKTRPACVLA